MPFGIDDAAFGGLLAGGGSSLLGSFLGGGSTGPDVDAIIKDLLGPKGIGLNYLSQIAPGLVEQFPTNKKGNIKGRPDISFGTNRALALSGLLGFQDTLNNRILPFIQSAGGDLSQGFRDRGADVLGQIGAGTSDLESFLSGGLESIRGEYGKALGEANRNYDAGAAAIEQNYQDTVREGSNAIDASLRSRGFGGSTMQDAGVINDLLPQAIGGKLNALASLEAARNQAVQQASLAGAGAYANMVGQTNSILAGRIGQEDAARLNLFGGAEAIDQELFRTMLSTYLAGNNFMGQTLAQPSQVFVDPRNKNPFFVAPQSASSIPSFGQNIGAALAGLGGDIFGSALGSIFG